MNKESRISVKIEEGLKSRIDQVVESTGIGEPSLIRACVVALCDYVEEHGEITVPFAVLPKSEFLRLSNQAPAFPILKAAETPVKFTPGKKQPKP